MVLDIGGRGGEESVESAGGEASRHGSVDEEGEELKVEQVAASACSGTAWLDGDLKGRRRPWRAERGARVPAGRGKREQGVREEQHGIVGLLSTQGGPGSRRAGDRHGDGMALGSTAATVEEEGADRGDPLSDF